MRRHIGAVEIANEICMKGSATDNPFIIVEGNTDLRLYGKFMTESVSMVPGHSKDNVLGAMEELRKRGFDDALGIVDGDYDRILGHDMDAVSVFWTDTHDMETMIMRSWALEDILFEYAEREDLHRFESRRGCDLRQALLEAARPIGALVLVSIQRKLNLSFKGLDPAVFVDPSDLSVDVHSLVLSVFHNTRHRVNARASDLESAVERVLREGHDPWQLCRGHDMVRLLLFALQRVFGSYNAMGLDEGALGGGLRLAYDMRMFSETDLYSSIVGWEGEHDRRVVRRTGS